MNKTILLLGVILLAIALLVIPAIGLVTLVIDVTPPELVFSCPANGKTYPYIGKPVFNIIARAEDPESGIKYVTITIDGKTLNTTKVHQGVETNETVTYYVPIEPYVITKEGTYEFTWTIVNEAGLKTEVSGTFTIYPPLQGKVTVNGQEVTSETVLYYTKLPVTLTFRFEKTVGVEDSKINVKLSIKGAETANIPMTYQGNSIWTATYTFTKGGKYTIELTASDGTTTVTMSILSLKLPGYQYETTLTQAIQLSFGTLGAVLIVWGLLEKGGRKRWI